MRILATIFVLASALVQFYAAYQEMFTWCAFSNQVLGLDTHLEDNCTVEPLVAVRELTRQLGLNQGLYNVFLAVGILFAIPGLASDRTKLVGIFALACMAVAGIFGYFTVVGVAPAEMNNIRVFGAQALPPILALVSLHLVERRDAAPI